MKVIVMLLACCAGISSSAHAALQVEVKKFPKDTSSNEYLPYETLRAQQNFPVTLYFGDHCGEPCVQAREYLNKRGIPFSEKPLRTKKEIDAFKKQSGFDAFVPTLVVGNNFIKGFEQSQWSSELDIAGYPKSATYRQRTAPPSTPAQTPSPEGQTSEGQTSPAIPAEQ